MSYDDLVENIAAQEHEQWLVWSKNIAESESLSKERLKRWERLWIPYSELTEDQKEQDRVWARKHIKTVLKDILEEEGVDNKEREVF